MLIKKRNCRPATNLKKVGPRSLPIFVKKCIFVFALNELIKAELRLTGPPHNDDGEEFGGKAPCILKLFFEW